MLIKNGEIAWSSNDYLRSRLDPNNRVEKGGIKVPSKLSCSEDSHKNRVEAQKILEPVKL